MKTSMKQTTMAIGCIQLLLVPVVAVSMNSALASQAKLRLQRIQDSVQKELAAADLGQLMPFDGMNLDGIEASLLSMAQEGSTPGLTPFVTEINTLVAQMKGAVATQSRTSQSSLTRAWSTFTACSFSASSEFKALQTLNSSHRACSDEESTLYADWQKCLTKCTDPCQYSNYECEKFNAINKYPAVGRCRVTDQTMYPKTREWMVQLRDVFRDEYFKWADQKHKCDTRKKVCTDCYSECSTKEKAYKLKETTCSTYQSNLEKSACDKGTNTCQEYFRCYDTAKKEWEKVEKVTEVQETAFLAEFRGLLRIECLLEAFKQNLEQGVALAPRIAACRDKDYKTTAFTGHLRINYPNITSNKRRDCLNETGAKANGQSPGSPGWIKAFYSNMPDNTYYETCDACCCVDLEGGPTC
eukprot:TRINITY_DN2094_c5_g1_i1.p1 TRINITY_DN2094_c5_g1~~TRINITY_DN2094_c5_g1_i1.p1  ORF type:complete len:413 (+),score=81.94 TRINITY_DN2094_c5_g1_i1:52-1290(+)